MRENYKTLVDIFVIIIVNTYVMIAVNILVTNIVNASVIIIVNAFKLLSKNNAILHNCKIEFFKKPSIYKSSLLTSNPERGISIYMRLPRKFHPQCILAPFLQDFFISFRMCLGTMIGHN